MSISNMVVRELALEPRNRRRAAGDLLITNPVVVFSRILLRLRIRDLSAHRCLGRVQIAARALHRT
jgi:hypothetical protein